jgi:hypothetical protein
MPIGCYDFSTCEFKFELMSGMPERRPSRQYNAKTCVAFQLHACASIVLQLSAHLASESARCRLAIGRESGFVAGLVRFMSTLGEEDDSAEAVAAAVAVLSQVSSHYSGSTTEL